MNILRNIQTGEITACVSDEYVSELDEFITFCRLNIHNHTVDPVEHSVLRITYYKSRLRMGILEKILCTTIGKVKQDYYDKLLEQIQDASLEALELASEITNAGGNNEKAYLNTCKQAKNKFEELKMQCLVLAGKITYETYRDYMIENGADYFVA
jgi:hypothetical protein